MAIFDEVKNQLVKDVITEDFMKMVQQNIMSFNRLMAYYRCAMMEVETKFKVLNEQFSIQYDRNPIETIKTRWKSMDSIAGKLRRKNLPVNIDSIEKNLNDVAGIRIICSFPEDIYMLSDCLLQQDDVTLIEKRDYIKNPKPSGYRSLHLIVEIPIFLENEKRFMRTEVQLRTIAMDFWASLEHKLRYKKNISDEESEYLSRELIECAEISAQLDQRMENIRNRMTKADTNGEVKD